MPSWMPAGPTSQPKKRDHAEEATPRCPTPHGLKELLNHERAAAEAGHLAAQLNALRGREDQLSAQTGRLKQQLQTLGQRQAQKAQQPQSGLEANQLPVSQFPEVHPIVVSAVPQPPHQLAVAVLSRPVSAFTPPGVNTPAMAQVGASLGCLAEKRHKVDPLVGSEIRMGFWDCNGQRHWMPGHRPDATARPMNWHGFNAQQPIDAFSDLLPHHDIKQLNGKMKKKRTQLYNRISEVEKTNEQLENDIASSLNRYSQLARRRLNSVRVFGRKTAPKPIPNASTFRLSQVQGRLKAW